MGAFRVRVEIPELDGTRVDTIEALVDTRATYTCLPADLLDSLGVRRSGRSRWRMHAG